MTTGEPTYLVTGAGGGVGGVSRTLVDRLLATGRTVRAMVRRDDERAAELRSAGADVVVGDLTRPVDVATALRGVNRVFYSMSVSDQYLEATAVVCALAAETAELEILVNMSQMTVSQMTPTSTTESHHQRWHWLAEHIIDWAPFPAVHVRPTVFLENPLFTVLAAPSVRADGVLRLPFGAGHTSPVAAADVADSVAAILEDPARHDTRVYELTGPEVLDSSGLAERYSRALGRAITARDIAHDEFLRGLSELGLGPHITDHIATMARLHREDRYNRVTDTVQALTGHPARSVEEFVRSRSDLFE